MPACPCGTGDDYARCCGALHRGAAAPDAERLMRARYSAYVLGQRDYLLASWHPGTRPARLDLAGSPRWLGLKIKRFEPQESQAVVEFVARYHDGQRARRLHEVSRFERLLGQWLYVDGQMRR